MIKTPYLLFNSTIMSTKTINVSTHLDVLSDVLRTVRLNASSYFCVEFSSPWGLNEPATECGTFHAIIDGNAWVNIPNQDEPILLEAGDLIVFPTGIPHQISDGSEKLIKSGEEVLARIEQQENPFNKGEIKTTLLCGYFQYDTSFSLPFINDLPSILHIRSEHDASLKWLNHLLNTLASETRSSEHGRSVVVDRLTEVLIIQLLRWHMSQQSNTHGYFKALADPQLTKALSLIHQAPQKKWSVATISAAVGMSRTAFANHFSQTVGMTPLAYIRQWRMKLAKELLKNSNLAVISIAEKVGYLSEASFAKAFKQVTGTTPGQVRKNKKAVL